MLEYLKQKIAEKEQQHQSIIQETVNDSESQMDEAILECAHLFAEMEELTVTGTNALRERPVIDIPIEDDLELTTVEYDYMTQRLVDIPMDVQTSEAFSREKHFEDFYNEAAKSVIRMNRENDMQYEARIHQEATKRYNAYREYIIQEGLFGNDMLEFSDGRVPRTKLVDLGPIDLDKENGRHYITKLPVYFQVNGKGGKLVQLDQIHALAVADNVDAFSHFGATLRRILIEKEGYAKKLYNVGIWDITTPKAILVPIVDDKFRVRIVLDIEGMKDEYWMTFAIAKSEIHMTRQGKLQNEEEIKNKIFGSSDKDSKNDYITGEKGKSMDDYKSKKDMMDEESKKDKKVQESVTPTFNRWTYGRHVYQEAIDFGDGTAQAPAAPDAGAGAPPPIDGAAPTDATVAPAADAQAPAVDGLGVGDDGTQPAAAPADNSTTVTTNDVSQQIADNVANITAANASSDGDLMSSTPTFDNNVDDTFNNLDSAMGADETGVDMGDGSTEPSGDVNPTPDLGLDTNPDTTATDVPSVESDPLSDLGADATDSIGSTDDTTDSSVDDLNTDDTSGGLGEVDIDNMSMDDMVTQAVEKIKTMPMNKLKSFLSDGTISESSVMFVDDVDLDMVMESVNNPTEAVSLAVRKVLGDLNDTKGSLADIVKNVKRDHKHANKAIVKAMKNTELGKSANAELENLNNALNELVLKLNATPAKEEVENIKNAIKNFTNATKRTSKFIDFNKGIVTESFSIIMNKDEMDKHIMESANDNEDVFNKLPSDYKKWLESADDKVFKKSYNTSDDTLKLFNKDKVERQLKIDINIRIDGTSDEKKFHYSNDHVAIAMSDGGDTYLIKRGKDSSVYKWDHETGKIKKIASDWNEFLDMIGYKNNKDGE